MHFASRADFDPASSESVKGIVAAHFYPIARDDLGASLAHDNRTRFGSTAIREFETQIFRVGIAPVFGCAGCFFMGHKGASIN